MIFLTSFPYPQPLELTNLFIVSIVLPFSECHMVVIIECVGVSDWLLSLSNVHLMFLNVFSWLDSTFIFSTDIFKLSGKITFYLSVHPLKDIFIAFSFCQLCVSMTLTSLSRFFCESRFSTLLVNTKGDNNWVINKTVFLWKKMLTFSQSGCTIFYAHQQLETCCSVSLDFDHWIKSVWLSPCWFNLHFPDDF
jgi:hypothetical protein